MIESMKDILDLEKKYKSLVLTDDEPRKGQEFILWRGAKKAKFHLMASLQVHLQKKDPAEWKTKIKEYEKNLINRFLNKILPYGALKEQYSWFEPQQHLEDMVWYLSVMQHYGCPTRFADFTSCFWTAIFFAADGAQPDTDMILYSLKCKNEDENNRGGNKLPKDCRNEPWRDSCGRVNINDFLGQIIGCRGFEKRKDLSNWESPNQPFGWDQPKMRNARVSKQNGYFVYPVDVSQTLEEILTEREEFEKYVISGKLLPEIKRKLEERNLDSWCVYLDIERALEKLKEDSV